MDLRLRKRLNNIPKFNNGVDIDAKVGFKPNNLEVIASDLKQMVGDSAPTGPTISPSFAIGQKPASLWNNKGGITLNAMQGLIVSYIGNTIGGAFDLSNKFSNNSSKLLGTISDITSKIPGAYGLLAGGVFKLASNYLGMANYSHGSSEMMNQAGTTERSINGIGYTEQNMLDTKSAYNDVSKTGVNNTISSVGTGAATGAALGTIIPGLGTVAGGIIGGVVGGIGSLFGASKARRRLNRIGRNAIAQTNVINSANMASADTVGLENNYYANNYDTTGGILYANRGKDLKLRKRINRAKV